MASTRLFKCEIVFLYTTKLSCIYTVWTYRYGTSCSQKKRSVSNLLQKTECKHLSKLKLARARKLEKGQWVLCRLLYRPKVSSVDGSLDYVIDRLRPFFMVPNTDVREHTRFIYMHKHKKTVIVKNNYSSIS